MLLDSFIRSPLVGAAVFVAFKTAVQRNGTAVFKATNTAAPTSGDLMKLSNHIGENSMVWIDGKTAYNSLLSAKQCEIRVMKDHTTYTSIDHLNTVNAFHRLIEKWYKGYNGVAASISIDMQLYSHWQESIQAVMHRKSYYQSRKECIRSQISSVLLT